MRRIARYKLGPSNCATTFVANIPVSRGVQSFAVVHFRRARFIHRPFFVCIVAPVDIPTSSADPAAHVQTKVIRKWKRALPMS